MVIQFSNSKELLESTFLVTNIKKDNQTLQNEGCDIDIMRQSACVVVNPITIHSYAFLFNCTMVGQASDSMMAPT